MSHGEKRKETESNTEMQLLTIKISIQRNTNCSHILDGTTVSTVQPLLPLYCKHCLLHFTILARVRGTLDGILEWILHLLTMLTHSP
jgi:hypothetical protein